MKKHIRDFVRRCLTCQQVKAKYQRLARLLQPLEVAEWKWEHVTMDFVTHFPRTSRGHDTVWVIVDRLTKSAHFLAVWMTFTLEEFYRLYVREIVRLHGIPISIVLDRDPRFTAHFWKSPASHGDIADDEHRFSSLDGQLIREDHPDVKGHATSMHP